MHVIRYAGLRPQWFPVEIQFRNSWFMLSFAEYRHHHCSMVTKSLLTGVTVHGIMEPEWCPAIRYDPDVLRCQIIWE